MKDRAPARSVRGRANALIALLADPSFAIVTVIALAVVSILALVLIDQVPFRGEMARIRYPGRESEPLVWTLIHLAPANPFRSLVFRTLLALLTLSLLVCTLKRARRAYHQALDLTPPGDSVFSSPRAVRWISPFADAPARAHALLRRKLFAIRTEMSGPATYTTAKRFGVSRAGPVLTHLGFLLLVVGAWALATGGTSEMLWLHAGDEAAIASTDARIKLLDFRIETNPRGEISDYISSVALVRSGATFREASIEVNEPLRYQGRSIYQASYRASATRVRSIDLALDVAADETQTVAGTDRPFRHGQSPGEFARPVTFRVGWDERVDLAPTPYSVEIDTFLADFRIDRGVPSLASEEARNPAARLLFFESGRPAGATWYFAHHPEMAVGSGPDLALRLANFAPEYTTGLEIATHPGAGWVWAGIAVMTLGTLLAFVLRYETAWLRVRPRADGTFDVTCVHIGASAVPPEYARSDWERQVTPLDAELGRCVEPTTGRPVAGPGADAPPGGSIEEERR